MSRPATLTNTPSRLKISRMRLQNQEVDPLSRVAELGLDVGSTDLVGDDGPTRLLSDHMWETMLVSLESTHHLVFLSNSSQSNGGVIVIL
jgi:hypothetical protein